MTVRRFDIGSLKSPERMPNGWLRADAYLTRVGVFSYLNADGTERRELRLPEEVFKGDSMKSFGLVPVTNDHPPALLTAENTKQYQVGAVGEGVRRDGEYVRASLLITDAATIAAMEAGKQQLSNGYTCELDMTPGEWNGQRYDAIQRGIRGNHVAIVDVGRAGPGAHVRMDEGDGVMVPCAQTEEVPAKEKLMKYRFDGKDFEINEEASTLVAAMQTKLDAETARASENAGKLAVATSEIGRLEQARKDDAAQIPALVTARVALVTEASKFLGDVKLDTMSDREVKIAVLTKLDAEFKADGMDDSAINGAYGYALRIASKRNDSLDAARAAAVSATEARTDERPDADRARAKMIEENRNKWRQPIAGGTVKK